MPDKVLEKQPQLNPGLDFYFQAYQELQADRNIGMTAGPIPWYSVIKWAEFHGLNDPDDVDVLLRYIRTMEKAAEDALKKKEDEKK